MPPNAISASVARAVIHETILRTHPCRKHPGKLQSIPFVLAKVMPIARKGRKRQKTNKI